MKSFATLDWILERYGLLLTPDDLAKVLRYSSAAAVRQAHQSGRLPVRLIRIENRRGLFARAEDVASVIETAESAVT